MSRKKDNRVLLFEAPKSRWERWGRKAFTVFAQILAGILFILLLVVVAAILAVSS